MLLNPEFEKQVKARYEELKAKNETEGLLEVSGLGNIKIFINIEPEKTLLSFAFESDNVYVGS